MMGFSLFRLWNIYSEYSEGEKFYEEYTNKFVNTVEVVEVTETETETEETVEVKTSPISIDFDALFAENKDIVGWVYSEATPINYPIVQSGDNDYYLRRMLDGSYTIGGSIFMDYRNSSDLSDFNTIVYGHNMKNGSMFGTLESYESQKYYDDHPIIYYFTPDETYEVQLVTGYVTDAWSDTYNIPQTIEEQNQLTRAMESQSTFKSDYSFVEGDKIITLSTCAYDFNDARYVVIGKLIKIDGLIEFTEENAL